MTQPQLNPAFKAADEFENAGNWAAAEKIYREILSRFPNQPAALYGLGKLAIRAGRPEALELLSRAAALRPDLSAIHAVLAVAQQQAGQFDAALAGYGRAIQLDPVDTVSLLNQGDLLIKLERFDEAIECCDRVIAQSPGNPAAFDSRGLALLRSNRLEEALAAFRESIAARPDFARGHFHLGMLLLTLGQFEEGWREYEWRWATAEFPSRRHQFAQPRWDGAAPRDSRSTILLFGEQGFGDVIQFARYLPLVKQRGWQIVLGCAPELVRMMRMSPELGATHVIDSVESAGHPVRFDVQLPLASLPLVLGEIDPHRPAIPARPYLSVDSDVRNRIRGKIPDKSGFRIGIAWAGSPTHLNDRNRSMSLENLAPLAAPGRTFFSFQFGPAAAQAARPPAAMQLIDMTSQLTDFADSAALMLEMDLLITVDTAAGHLAGALGKPAWVLLPRLPDFRWLLDRQDSPLYPTMRLFRQKRRGDWDEVIGRVAGELPPVASCVPQA